MCDFQYSVPFLYMRSILKRTWQNYCKSAHCKIRLGFISAKYIGNHDSIYTEKKVPREFVSTV